MNLQNITKELNLLYFKYDEINKVFLIKPNYLKNSNALNEFVKIVTILKEKHVIHEILNTKCILIKT